jgi:hypothetical protein
MKWRSFLGLAGVMAVAAMLAPPAVSQQVCLQLESQLAALERQDNQAAYRAVLAQYERARASYDAAYRQADQAGCIPRLFRLQVPPGCQTTRAQLDAMLAELTRLQQQLQSFSPDQNAAERNNLLRSLAANNCGAQYEPYANQGGGRLLDRLFGPPQNVIGNPGPLVITYRTLCVRGCDGYYFPISFSTTPAQFEADQRTCQAQCPGATLYYHQNPGAPVETAVSVNGQPYTLLPNAFAFREAYHPECGCQSVTRIAAAGDEPRFTPIGPEAAAAIAAVAAMPMPVERPEPTEDPETIANRLGGFEPGAFTLGDVAGADTVMITDDGLRLIGPAYYYAQ